MKKRCQRRQPKRWQDTSDVRWEAQVTSRGGKVTHVGQVKLASWLPESLMQAFVNLSVLGPEAGVTAVRDMLMAVAILMNKEPKEVCDMFEESIASSLALLKELGHSWEDVRAEASRVSEQAEAAIKRATTENNLPDDPHGGVGGAAESEQPAN